MTGERGSRIETWRDGDAFHLRLQLDDVDAQRMDPIDLHLLQAALENLSAVFSRAPSTADEPIEGTCREVAVDEHGERLPPAALLDVECAAGPRGSDA